MNIVFCMSIVDDKVFIGFWGGMCIFVYYVVMGEFVWVFDVLNYVIFDMMLLDVNGVVYVLNLWLWVLDVEIGKVFVVGWENLSDNLGVLLLYDLVGC